MFDPTQFNHLQDVEIKCRVKTGGIWYEDTYTARASNYALLTGLDSLEDISTPQPSASTTRQGTKVSQENLSSLYWTHRRIDQWTPADYFFGLLTPSLHHYCGHSNTNGVLDGTHVGTNSGGLPLGAMIDFNEPSNPANSVHHNRASVFGSTLPPFSPGPALNFTFLQSCESTNPIATSDSYMFPNLNGYGKYRENQCVLGYVKFSSIDSYRYGSEKLFPKLCSKHVVIVL
jgi:hypothetical protein